VDASHVRLHTCGHGVDDSGAVEGKNLLASAVGHWFPTMRRALPPRGVVFPILYQQHAPADAARAETVWTHSRGTAAAVQVSAGAGRPSDLRCWRVKGNAHVCCLLDDVRELSEGRYLCDQKPAQVRMQLVRGVAYS
jgi:hypothetical protein